MRHFQLLQKAGVVVALGFAGIEGYAQSSFPKLSEMSLEDLMEVTVTSVSKKAQELAKTGAAVYVISQEDIRRSGATTLPDVLRLAPGMNIAQVDANVVAISIRGFTSRYVNKVLLLIDGRSAYTPATSGVHWDQVDVMLDDIDRVEVIRGPGGTIWGANAMNGVINIITKTAGRTQGSMLSVAGGTQNTARGAVRYGDAIGARGAYRAYGNYFNTGSRKLADGSRGADGWHSMHGGFRSDWDLTPSDKLTVQGDLSDTGEGQTISVVFSNRLPAQGTFNDPVTTSSGNVLGRWDHTLAGGSETSLQVYYDRYHRTDLGVGETMSVLDGTFHHHVALGASHDVVWGGGYRMAQDSFVPGYAKVFSPPSRETNLVNTFFQDEIRLGHSVFLTAGSKFEHNSYTGFEYEPSAQLVWQVSPQHTLWVSGARAIAQPDRSEVDLTVDLAIIPLPNSSFGVLQLQGDPKVTAEKLWDFESGYRAQLNRSLSLDFAAFTTWYNDLASSIATTPYFTTDPNPPHLVFPRVLAKTAQAHTYGAEMFAKWSVNRRWKLEPGVTGIHMSTRQLTSGTSDIMSTPRVQLQARSYLNVTRHVEWDVIVYHTASLRQLTSAPIPVPPTPAYVRLDTRLGWRVGEHIELSLVGQNLTTPRHWEFHDAYEVLRTQVERSVSAGLTWRY